MFFEALQKFVNHLEDVEDLIRVKAPVDPYLETAAIIDQVCKGASHKRALLFENVKGSKIPLVANLFGSQQRVATALGVDDIEQLAKKLRDDLSLSNEKDSAEALAKLTQNSNSERVCSDVSPCFAIDMSEQGLDVLPALHSWPDDGGRYLTLGQIFTRGPDSGQQNCGMYRVQILDKLTALIRCHPGSGGGSHMAAWHERGKAMPVAIVLGGPPVLNWCAGVSLPDNVSEMEFASYLTGQSISMTKCRGSDLRVPSNAEIVIEGHIFPGDEQLEGPFGNHTGYYVPASPAPVVRVKSVYMREDAVYPCTVVGPPPMENMYLAQAAERLLLPLLQHDNPWVIDIHMPLEGIYHRVAMVSVDAENMPVEEINKALWQSTLLRNSRLIVLLDKESDLRSGSNIYWRVINANPWTNSVWIDGEKVVIDARRSSQKTVVRPDQSTLNEVVKRWQEFDLGTLS
jgi:4-hydroxy-3-polyprenylbenzoate decarboxylase